MKIKKFTAQNSRDALRKVKETLGADALILSNRPVAGGVEIVALAAAEARELHKAKVTDAQIDMPLPVNSQPRIQPAPWVPGERVQSQPGQPIEQQSQPVAQPAAQAARPLPQPAEVPLDRMEMENLISEIKLMRSMLEEQLAGFAWADMQRKEPVKVTMMRRMLSSGFSPKLSRQLIDKMPSLRTDKEGMDWVKTALIRNLNIASVETDIVDRGGVFAIVGPTGVGKTTTTAKLAARCVVRHGADRLALITTDSYRIGAHEQLKIYGRILGVPVHAIKDASDLSVTLSELREKHLVLIDTIGMSQKDQKVIDQIAMLSGCDADVERILLLNATSGGDTLDDVVRAYRGNGLSGCIVTKVDEAVSLGATLDVIIRNKLSLHYIANGQRVPEDLRPANAQYLLERTFRAARDNTPHSLTEMEYPLVLAADQAARYTETMGA